MKRYRFRAAAIAIAVVCLASGKLATADTSWNIAGTGDFLTGGNWTNSAPSTTNNAFIDNGGTAELTDPNSFDNFVGNITLGSTAGTSGNLVLDGSDLYPQLVEIGKLGSGELTVDSGYFDNDGAGESIYVGGHDNSGGTSGVGIMNVNGGYVRSDDDLTLGRNGTGTVNFTGGAMLGVYTVLGKFGTGTWNQSGGVYDQYQDGDFEIGDGGKPGSDESIPGARSGVMNLSGGVVQVDGAFAMGNRIGSSDVTISGGALSITGDSSNNTLYVGRGMNWSEGSGLSSSQMLRVSGDDAIIAVGLDLLFDPDNVFGSATLAAEITGPTHTPILVGRDANITNGSLKVELDGYTPSSGDSWTLIEAGVDLTSAIAAIDAMVAAEGPLDLNKDFNFDELDVLSHDTPDAGTGSVTGIFESIDTSMAPLPGGLSWEVDYTDTSAVVLKVVGAPGLAGDYNSDDVIDAADYAYWRNHLGETFQLDNEVPGVTPGEVTVEDYDAWRERYGNAVVLSGVANSPVPEPTALAGILALLAAGPLGLRQRNR